MYKERQHFNIAPSSFVHIENELLEPLANVWAPLTTINLDKINLNVFAQAVQIDRFCGTAAVWDSTPVEIPLPFVSHEAQKEFYHPHYRTTIGHKSAPMPCIRYGIAIISKPLSLLKLRERHPNLLTEESFNEWKAGLPVALESVTEFNPSDYENLAVGVSKGYRGAVHDKHIFEGTGIGPYITSTLAVASDLQFNGQQQLLGRPNDHGTLQLKHRKPQRSVSVSSAISLPITCTA
jgi:hypothetical protein